MYKLISDQNNSAYSGRDSIKQVKIKSGYNSQICHEFTRGNVESSKSSTLGEYMSDVRNNDLRDYTAQISTDNHSRESQCAYVLLIVAFYWLLEPVPIAAAAMLPVVLFPILGIISSTEVCQNYMKEGYMALIGGLMAAIAVENCKLHERIALKVLLLIGSEIKWLLLGLMLTTSFLSMWMSNTAATALMVPIVDALAGGGRKVLDTFKKICRTKDNFELMPKEGATDTGILVFECHFFASFENCVILKMTSPSEKANCVGWYVESKSIVKVQRNFHTKFNKPPPSRNSILSWHKKFLEAGSVLDKPRSGRPSTSDSDVERIREAFTGSPTKSTRQASIELGVARSSIRDALHKRMHLKPYKMQLVQQLKPSDLSIRFNFAVDMLHRIDVDNDFLQRIIFTDEATFHMSGHVNKHNTRI
ncbi:Sodium-dependent high-affinity dicarboxylate transporter 3 [Araneus ventricosus]|uniref:Sodium-dependent high-affinity dicarboxylate transporter 3 n=1 Tax=Araneus ventricosus TaxID=182803 RepID=A0A4Y2MTF5_ARAVE|nr:Sodium-dependent high-affinity dicarboxylate transporter 3 [Araneus ventricosus]